MKSINQKYFFLYSSIIWYFEESDVFSNASIEFVQLKH